jgi:hypothetical protein
MLISIHAGLKRWVTRRMTASFFTCPITDLNVQHWLDDNENVPDTEYEAVTCQACTRIHLINRKTGRLLGQIDEPWAAG